MDEQVKAGGYETVSEFMREVLRKAKRERWQEQIESMLIEGLDSGPGVEATPEFWTDRKRELKKRVARRKDRKR